MKMKTRIFYLLITIAASSFLEAQNIKVQPYLQDAFPTSIIIMWETDSLEESTTEWGLTEILGNTSTGTSQISVGESRIHEVKLEGLQRFTRYYYRVKTGDAISAIHSFKTPPFAEDHESFRIIAMSDMQRDNSFPDKFEEIVNDGIIDYLENEFGGDLADNLALVIIPGDLVVNGNDYTSWEESFFTPSQKLFSQVPVYPVPGNHENNAIYFFQYFHLPDNGSEGFEEHWWYKDYGNVRIIGLDSNNPFSNQDQLDWLDLVLNATCEADSIDFVFAQLHHPHKSELWTPGESNYTGEVIDRLEQFSTWCSKPSIHFFGHTHGYSRGNSRDHKHLWINAATAGGAIDNWGEFPNFDYDEFSVSQDEYGFVSVEVSDGIEPKIVVKRISRGDQDFTKNNEITDSITMGRDFSIASVPFPISPINEEVIPECVTLRASYFTSPNPTDAHGQSHWQVSANPDDFTNPKAESWKTFENWYFEEDTQADDDLADEEISGLDENSDYWWRVRYRDRELNWTDWTTPAAFSTGASITSPNLLINPGAEDSLYNWMVVEGIVEALADGVCDGTSPHSGSRYFAVGGLCEHSDIGRFIQNVDVSIYSDSIDTGNFSANFGGFLSDFGGSDLPEIRLIFLNQDSLELSVSNTLSTLNSSWTLLSQWVEIPEQTRIIQVELTGTRNAGTDNDSYFDDLFLKLAPSDRDCSSLTSIKNPVYARPSLLNVSPNPAHSTSRILLPLGTSSKTRLSIVDAKGSKVSCPTKYQENQIIIDRRNLEDGTYFLFLRDEGHIIGRATVIFN